MHVQFVAGQLCKIINLSHAMPTKLPRGARAFRQESGGSFHCWITIFRHSAVSTPIFPTSYHWVPQPLSLLPFSFVVKASDFHRLFVCLFIVLFYGPSYRDRDGRVLTPVEREALRFYKTVCLKSSYPCARAVLTLPHSPQPVWIGFSVSVFLFRERFSLFISALWFTRFCALMDRSVAE